MKTTTQAQLLRRARTARTALLDLQACMEANPDAMALVELDEFSTETDLYDSVEAALDAIKTILREKGKVSG